MKIFLIGCLALACPAAATAVTTDDTIVDARVDATRIGEGDSLKLTIEVRGANPGSIDEPDLSGLADFTIAAGPSVSSSTSMLWTGGQATSTTSKQFTYVLFPRRRGTLTIPTVSVRIGSRVRQTNPISIDVVEGRLLQRAPTPGRGGTPGIGPARRSGQPAGEVHVEAQVDRKEVYVGEQVVLTYRIFTQVQLMELPAPQRLPSYTGFWVEEIPVDPRASIHRVVRGGKEFIELTLMKKALFATTSGNLVIEETIFGLPVKVESNDPFDSIFFTPTTTLLRKTPPLTIKVKPLPTQGRPASFNGAVGRYTLQVVADRQEAKVNEAVGLRITVNGKGNIRTVGEPVLPPMPDYKKYAPRMEEKKDLAQEQLTGSKTWDYVLTPLASGRQDIPPIKFSWFDPARGAYAETASEEIPIVVARGEGGPAVAGATPGALRREVSAFGRDIRYIKPVSDLSGGRAAFHRSATFVTLLAAPVLINAALFFFVRRRESLMANAGLARRRRAPGFARRRLKEARRLMAAGRPGEFHQEVARALTGYLGDKLDLSPSGLTHERIDALLAARGVDESARAELQRCLESCDYARFAPVAPGAVEMQRLLERAEVMLGRLERHLVSGRGGGAAVGAFLVLTLALGPGADQKRLFTEGNEHYAAGDFEQAAKAYRQLITQGYGSWAIHYNLGNALYKSGRIGPAILEYEKAAGMAPNEPDLLANLEFVRARTADKTTAGAQTTSFFIERLLSMTTLDQDAVILISIYLVMGALVAVRIVATRPAMRRAALWGMAALALPLAVAAGGFGVKLSRAVTTTHAIVLQERLDVHSGPGEDNTTLFTVHEGLKVRVRDKQGSWLLVNLANGLNGWVPASAVGVI